MEGRNKNNSFGDKFNLARLHNDVVTAKQNEAASGNLNEAMSNLIKALAEASPEVIKQLKKINQ